MILANGCEITVRQIEATDNEALVKFHEGLSQKTVYYRFFNCHPHLSVRECEHFTCVDGWDRLALVATVGVDLIAVARFERTEDPECAEVAFVVADEWQHQGVGTMMMARLSEAARERGIKSFVAETMFGNHAMLTVFHHSGYSVESDHSQGVVSLSIDISERGGV
jgi:GNAT superfamily N-acetyltransferase